MKYGMKELTPYTDISPNQINKEKASFENQMAKDRHK